MPKKNKNRNRRKNNEDNNTEYGKDDDDCDDDDDDSNDDYDDNDDDSNVRRIGRTRKKPRVSASLGATQLSSPHIVAGEGEVSVRAAGSIMPVQDIGLSQITRCFPFPCLKFLV